MDQTNQNQPVDGKAIEPEILPPLSSDQVISNAIKQFSETEATDAKIAEIKEIAATLSIAGVDDKQGYKKVDAARKRVKAIRLAVSKKATELLELPKDFTSRVKAEEKRLIAALKPIEDDLQLKQKVIDDVLAEQKRKKEEAEQAEKRKIAFREKALYELGALRDGEGKFIVGEFGVTPEQIKTSEEDEFSLLIQAIKQTLPQPEPTEAAPASSEPLPADTAAATVPAPAATQTAPATTPAATVGLPVQRTRPATATATANAAQASNATQAPNLQFVAGFEAAKRQIVAILQSPDPMKRSELINAINNLKP